MVAAVVVGSSGVVGPALCSPHYVDDAKLTLITILPLVIDLVVLCLVICGVTNSVDKNIMPAMAKTNGDLCAASGEKVNTIIAKDASEMGDTMSDLDDVALFLSKLKAIEVIAAITNCVDVDAEINDIETVPNEACKEISSSFKG